MKGARKRMEQTYRRASLLYRHNAEGIKLLLAAGLLYLLLSLLVPAFGSVTTFTNILSQVPEFGLYAMAMMLSMLIGGIDLSIIAVGNLSTILGALFVKEMVARDLGQEGIFVALGALLVVLVGCICGLVNGLLTTKIGIVPFLTTLGTMQLFNGITMMITDGKAVSNLPSAYSALGMKKLGFVPICFLVFLAVTLLLAFLVNKTVFGQKVLLVGSNQNVARFSGIHCDKTILYNSVLGSAVAACAGLVLSSHVSSAKPGYGDIYQLQAILAVMLGGVDSNGGYGRVFSVFSSVLVLQVITTGVNAMRLGSQYFDELAWGCVLIGELLIKYAIRYWRENYRRRWCEVSGKTVSVFAEKRKL